MNINSVLWLAAVLFALWQLAKLLKANPSTYKPF
jgi:hypothetical protein